MQDVVEEHIEGKISVDERVSIMENNISDIENARKTLRQESPWSSDTKVSTDFLDPLFDSFYNHLNLPNLMQKPIITL